MKIKKCKNNKKKGKIMIKKCKYKNLKMSNYK